MKINRRNKRVWLAALGVFVAVFLFTFLTAKFKGDEDVDAANLANFDAGYIMSDYQMGNYNSMSEADIQRFLTAKNPCNNTDYNSYVSMTNRYPGYSWHWANGHFICISEERFGDGEVIGSGDTAAHIIWQAAQDYRINPQVLIVLLQKEQGLITDTFPHNRQYRAATGYGCPDTAACSSQYYGFKNQVRKAAAMFRTVLDGGWTNYPLGWNYVQYNPNSACGGSWINIRSLATSALYRYTPYQPNASALAAGYGTGDACGAYGNRNFYNYFEDWFGGVTSTGYSRMDTPRYMVNVETGEVEMYRYKRYDNGGMCLSDSEKNGFCVPYVKLKNVDWEWNDMETPRYLTSNRNTIRVDLTEGSNKTDLSDSTIYYNKKTVLPDGRQCLLPEDQKYISWCAVFDTMEETKFKEQEMAFPRAMEAKAQTYFIDLITKKRVLTVNKGDSYDFYRKVYLPDTGTCLIVENKQGCILETDLMETWNKMQSERMMVTKDDIYKINIYTGQYDKSVLMNKGMERRFVSKTYYGGEWCLRTEYDENEDNNNCVPLSKLGETWEKLINVEMREIWLGAQKRNAFTLVGGLIMTSEESRVFVSKIYIPSMGKWCYRTQYDDNLNTNYCFLEFDLK